MSHTGSSSRFYFNPKESYCYFSFPPQFKKGYILNVVAGISNTLWILYIMYRIQALRLNRAL